MVLTYCAIRWCSSRYRVLLCHNNDERQCYHCPKRNKQFFGNVFHYLREEEDAALLREVDDEVVDAAREDAGDVVVRVVAVPLARTRLVTVVVDVVGVVA